MDRPPLLTISGAKGFAGETLRFPITTGTANMSSISITPIHSTIRDRAYRLPRGGPHTSSVRGARHRQDNPGAQLCSGVRFELRRCLVDSLPARLEAEYAELERQLIARHDKPWISDRLHTPDPDLRRTPDCCGVRRCQPTAQRPLRANWADT